MGRIYFYKLTADNGGAPCIDGGRLLSLAICKPMIRSSAKKGDVIFGFAANSLHPPDNRLIYAARITRKLSNGGYYKTRRYFRRQDCIYRFESNRLRWRRNALHHGPKDLIHDLGKHPRYPRAHVLLSEDFRYFGSNGTNEYKSGFPRIKDAVEKLMQGHRVNHNLELQNELRDMESWLWKHTRKMIAGRPSGRPSLDVCHRDGSYQKIC